MNTFKITDDNILVKTPEHGEVEFQKENQYLWVIDLRFVSGCGKNGLEAVRQAMKYLFEETPCLVIFGTIPKKNKASRFFATACHWKTERLDDEYVISRMTIGRWIKHYGPSEKAQTKKAPR
jgi:hypothetical protein